MKINKEKFEFEFRQRARNTPLMTDIWCQGIRDLLVKESKLKNLLPLDYIFTADSCGYVDKNYKKKVIELIKSEVKKDHKKYIGYILKRLEEVVIEFESFCHTIKDKEPSVFLWKKFIKEMKLMTAWLYLPWYITEENILTDLILEKSAFGIEKVAFLTQPDKEMLYQQEEKSLLFMKQSDGDEVRLQKLLKKHQSKFSWMNTYFFLPIKPLSVEDFRKKLFSINTNEFESRVVERLKNLEEQKKVTKKIRDKKLMSLVLQARRLAFWLTSSVERSLQATASLYDFYRKLSQKVGTDFEDWNELNSFEIEKALSGKRLPKDFKKRKNSFVTFMHKGKVTFLYGKRALDITKNMAETPDTSEVKGVVAFKGVVRGVARIALTPEVSYKLTKEDVLVTSMTSPDYLSAMGRVKAFVTDEGGMLCHAAIVARELKKPCIIGTKIATKVLKDGDLVEVDANTGVVKILKKHNAEK